MKSEETNSFSQKLQQIPRINYTVILLIILPLVGFLFGIRYKQSRDFPSNQTKIDELSKQLAQKEEEIMLCIQDSAKAGNSYKVPYTFKDLGVYSPLLKDKEIANQVYTYKRQTITSKTLTLEQDDQKGSTAGVIVWEYTSFDGTTNDDLYKPYVIFGGYENYLNRPRIIDPNPKDKDNYTNPKNIRMFWSYTYCPKSICIVTLNFFSKYSPNGHPIYVQIWAYNPSYLSESGLNLNSPGINQAKEQLKNIADTIEDSSTHH